MFCANCGSNIPDGTKFCANCGSPVMQAPAAPAEPIIPETPVTPDIPEAPVYSAPAAPETPYVQQPVQQYAQQQAQQYTQPVSQQVQYTQQQAQQFVPPIQQPVEKPPRNAKVKKGVNKKLIIGIVAGIVVLAAIAVCLFLFVFNKGGYAEYDELLEDYFEAFEKADYEGIAKLYPKSLRDAYSETGKGAKDFLEYVDGYVSEYGEDIESWKVSTIEEYDEDKVQILEEVFGKDVKQYVHLCIDVVSGKNNTTVYFDMMIMDNSWYLLDVH